MHMKGYSIQNVGERSARARGKELDISLKDSVNIAHFLRGRGSSGP